MTAPSASGDDRGATGASAGDHGWAGWLLCGALVLLGGFLVVLALADDLVPPGLRPEAMVAAEEQAARSVLLLGGLCLVALAWGVLRFRRWAWWGTVAVGLLLVWPALSGLLAPLEGGTLRIRFLHLAVVACLPYLWARRRDFGIGASPRRIPRGP